MKLPAPMTVSQIAGFIGGKVHGPEDVTVSGIAVDPRLATEDDIALVTDRKLLKNLDEIKARIVIAPVGVEQQYPDRSFILVERPKMAIARITSVMKPRRFTPAPGVHPTAVVDETAELGEGVAVGPLAYIGPNTKIGARTVVSSGCMIGGKVVIGEKCLLHSGCQISDYTRIGDRTILHMGVAIGADGFGYTTERPANAELIHQGACEEELSDDRNPLVKIEQIGNVIIGSDVEIGANTTIDRATIGSTTIGDGAKIDNLVMIAHNCEIGDDVIVVANTTIGGSCKIGDRAILAGSVSMKDHTVVGKDAIIEGAAAVMKDIPARAVQLGIPATDARDYMTQLAHMRRLPKMSKEMRELKKRITQLEQLLLEKQLTK